MRSFPHRHGDATGKPETRDETRGCKKTSIFCARLPPISIFSARYQTGWNVTKCHACHAKRHDNLLGHIRIGDVFQLPPQTRRRHRKTSGSRQDTWMQKNQHFVRDFLQFWHFRRIIKQVGMSQSATLPRKTTWQPAWTHSNRRCFPASPIDTATPQENQRLETRHVDAEKLSFSLFLWLSTYLPIYYLCMYLCIDLSLSLFHLITYLSIYLKERCHWPETYRGLLAQKNGIPGFPFWGWWPMRCNWSFHKYVWFYATSSSQSNTIKYNPRSLFLCLDMFLLSCLFQNENFERQPSPLWNGPNVWTGG